MKTFIDYISGNALLENVGLSSAYGDVRWPKSNAVVVTLSNVNSDPISYNVYRSASPFMPHSSKVLKYFAQPNFASKYTSNLPTILSKIDNIVYEDSFEYNYDYDKARGSRAIDYLQDALHSSGYDYFVVYDEICKEIGIAEKEICWFLYSLYFSMRTTKGMKLPLVLFEYDTDRIELSEDEKQRVKENVQVFFNALTKNLKRPKYIFLDDGVVTKL